MFISSQRYLDEETVQAKREARDYVVTVSPEFEIDGVAMQAVIDGHHSLAAAEADGVEPEFVVATIQNDDRIALIESSIDDYLEVCYMDSDWYDVATGKGVF
jgi:signal transduction histidine kinase